MPVMDMRERQESRSSKPGQTGPAWSAWKERSGGSQTRADRRHGRRGFLVQLASGLVLGASGLAATERGAFAQQPPSASWPDPVTPAITHRQIRTNGIEMHIAEAGTGPLVVLVHGWPELWYSWRHQLPALAAAGYHAVAPDLRGYGGTDAPEPVESYSLRNQMADIVGLLDALGAEQAVLVGHDIGAGLTWACAELFPQRIAAHVALGIPYGPRRPAPPVQASREFTRNAFAFLDYFQTSFAEAELGADPRRTIRLFFFALSGDAPPELVPYLFTGKPAGAGGLDGMPEPAALPAWLTEADLDVYAEAYARSGFRGPLGVYRNMDRDWAELPEVGATGVTQPALFVGGRRDSALRFAGGFVEPMEAGVPNLRKIVLLPGCGHWTQQERPDDVNAELIDFLRREVER
jgi:pimeloyl-ACP methyl ester carboxylesterase